jgi:hypothetical protein
MKTTPRHLSIIFAALAYMPPPASALELFTSDKAAWHGFDRYDFLMDESDFTIKPFKSPAGEGNAVKTQVNGHLRCVVVVPKQAAAGNLWSWRGYYFDHEPQAEIELLKRGFHIGFIRSPVNAMARRRNSRARFAV